MLFFFNDTATTEIYTLSLHDALPIWSVKDIRPSATSSCRILRSVASTSDPVTAHRLTTTAWQDRRRDQPADSRARGGAGDRSEEHTSELQSRQYVVCRLLLEKKKDRG